MPGELETVEAMVSDSGGSDAEAVFVLVSSERLWHMFALDRRR